jgi:hypothetical protein
MKNNGCLAYGKVDMAVFFGLNRKIIFRNVFVVNIHHEPNFPLSGVSFEPFTTLSISGLYSVE